VLPKYIGFLYWGKLLNFFAIIFWLSLMIFLFLGLFLRNYIFGWVWISKSMFLFRYDCLVKILHSVHVQESSIPLVSNSTTVSHLRNQVSYSIPWRSFYDNRLFPHNRGLATLHLLCLIYIKLKNFISSVPITIIEVINNVPS